MEDFNEGFEAKLASRMRKVNPEQFFTLVKMHLSFELDIHTEDNDSVIEKAKLKKWGFLNFSKKPKSMMNLQQKGSDVITLTLEGISQVRQLIEYLSKEDCINQEGIFRRTGKLTRQQELKTNLLQGLPICLNDGTYSVHDCASVLKNYLAELPEPLLTELHYPAHCQIADWCNSAINESRLLRSIQLLLLLLPLSNRILLKYLIILLNNTAKYETSNKMNCDSLATLFTPHLMCPRKLSPEALHINSQNLSGLVAFMIKKGKELFDIPSKLATDIRAYWVEQERKLLSPCKKDLNESAADMTSTAHTVFSFVDHKLTAKANSTDDTQAALAELYAHIQAMPESAKKRRLVKQFNKENGQGTPRHVKHDKTKSLGDSIKKHIFHKKLLGNKKLMDMNIGCNVSRSSSEENVFSESYCGRYNKPTGLPKKLFSKSDNELNSDSFDLIHNENLNSSKYFSNSAGSLDSPTHKKFDYIGVDICQQPEADLEDSDDSNNDVNNDNDEKLSLNQEKNDKSSRKLTIIDENKILDEEVSDFNEKIKSSDSENDSKLTDKTIRRCNSEPIVMYSSKKEISDDKLMNTLISDATSPFARIKFDDLTPKEFVNHAEVKSKSVNPSTESKNVCFNTYGTYTSTPSDFLRRNVINEHGSTPFINKDNSMSPITQSTTKMTKAMQETMMTPRSRKPVIMISGSNLCNLASLENGKGSNKLQIVDINIDDIDNDNDQSLSIKNDSIENKENMGCLELKEHNLGSIENDNTSIIQPSMSITSTFREYLLSRSVLTASPVDLSFTSRTDDFEQSESDLNILNDESLSDSLLYCLDGKNPTSYKPKLEINNSNDNVNKKGPSPRKRGTNLQRNDSKRSVKSNNDVDEQHDKSNTNLTNLHDTFQETSF